MFRTYCVCDECHVIGPWIDVPKAGHLATRMPKLKQQAAEKGWDLGAKAGVKVHLRCPECVTGAKRSTTGSAGKKEG